MVEVVVTVVILIALVVCGNQLVNGLTRILLRYCDPRTYISPWNSLPPLYFGVYNHKSEAASLIVRKNETRPKKTFFPCSTERILAGSQSPVFFNLRSFQQRM